MQEQTLRNLIEPLVTTPQEGPPEYVSTAGRTLAKESSVTIATFESQQVTATVVDGDESYNVELAVTKEGLLAQCNCTVGHSGYLCPHSFATAFVVWDRG